MKKVHLIFLLLPALYLCSCTSAGSTADGATKLMDGSEKHMVFDMSDRLRADGADLSASAVYNGISFEYAGAVFYGNFVYIPFTVSGYDGKELPDFQVKCSEREDGPYYIDKYIDKDGRLSGAVYLPLREYKDSIGLKILGFLYEEKMPFGSWETDIPVKNKPAEVLELETDEEKTVNVFDAEYRVKKVTLTDFNIRLECGLKSNNVLTEEERMQRITSSESTGESGYYDSYVQVLYKDGTVSPLYEYCLADQNVMWAWFLEEGQIATENVRAVYIGGCEFVVE